MHIFCPGLVCCLSIYQSNSVSRSPSWSPPFFQQLPMEASLIWSQTEALILPDLPPAQSLDTHMQGLEDRGCVRISWWAARHWDEQCSSLKRARSSSSPPPGPATLRRVGASTTSAAWGSPWIVLCVGFSLSFRWFGQASPAVKAFSIFFANSSAFSWSSVQGSSFGLSCTNPLKNSIVNVWLLVALLPLLLVLEQVWIWRILSKIRQMLSLKPISAWGSCLKAFH